MEILKNLINHGKLEETMTNINLISVNPRNFYLDVLMAKNQEIYYDEDSIEE
jgi:hypothetical protein